MKKVIHLKLIGGEEILGTLIETDIENNSYFILSKVRSLMAQQLGNGQLGLGMLPFLMGDPDAEIKIRKDMIIGEPMTNPPKELEDSYLQQVSGLTFATQSKGSIKI